MSFGDAPTPPNPTTTSDAQQKYNIGAGTAQQNINMVDQTNPLGSLNYTQSGTNPDGTPKFSAATTYSQPAQSIFDQYLKTQGRVGQTAGNLASNSAGMYSQPANITGDKTFRQLQGWQQDYVNPIFRQQEANLDSKLQAQGIQLGSPAYANAQNLQARNEGDVNNQFFSTAQPLAFNQEMANYNLPLQTLQGLQELSQPTAPNFTATPTAQVQPANYAGLTSQNYQNQMQQYQNQQAGMWGLGKAGLMIGGTLLGGPAGGALAGGMGSMFGPSAGGAWQGNSSVGGAPLSGY